MSLQVQAKSPHDATSRITAPHIFFTTLLATVGSPLFYASANRRGRGVASEALLTCSAEPCMFAEPLHSTICGGTSVSPSKHADRFSSEAGIYEVGRRNPKACL